MLLVAYAISPLLVGASLVAPLRAGVYATRAAAVSCSAADIGIQYGGIQSVAVAVGDASKALAFYTGVLEPP